MRKGKADSAKGIGKKKRNGKSPKDANVERGIVCKARKRNLTRRDKQVHKTEDRVRTLPPVG